MTTFTLLFLSKFVTEKILFVKSKIIVMLSHPDKVNVNAEHYALATQTN